MGVNLIYYRLSQPGNNTDVYATTDAQLNLDRIHCSDIDIFLRIFVSLLKDLISVTYLKIGYEVVFPNSFIENNLLEIEDFAFDNYYKCKGKVPGTIFCTMRI